MKCPKCLEENKKSTVQINNTMSTDVYNTPYYDEDGIYHHHDTNIYTTHCRCSNNHEFVINERRACPSYPNDCNHAEDSTCKVIE